MAQALYDIVGSLKLVQDMIEEAGGEITPEAEAMLLQLSAALPAKVEGICKVIRHFELDEVVIREEIQRLNDRKAVASNAAARLKAYLKMNMESLGETKIKTHLFLASICKNSQPTICIGDDVEIPGEFAKVVTTTSLDREKVIEAWKTDPGSVPMCIRVTTGSHLRIK